MIRKMLHLYNSYLAVYLFVQDQFLDMIVEEEDNKTTLITTIEQYLKEAAQLNMV